MKRILTAMLTAVLVLLTAAVAAADTTVTVTGNTVDTSLGENGSVGWWFNRDTSTDTPYGFTRAEASLGDGSIYVEPIGANAADKFIAEYFAWQAVDEFDFITYDFLIAGNGTAADANDFYLNLYTNLPGSDPNNYYDCRFDYVPSTGSTAGFTTFSVYPGDTPANVRARGGASCPTTLGGLEPGSTIRMFSISVGDTSAGDEGLAGYLDAVKIVNAGGATTFDFERAPQTLTVDDDGAECADAFETIQAAVDAAESFDTVLVCPGTYTETVTIGTDDLTLTSTEVSALGANTILQAMEDISARPDITALTISGDRVDVSGLQVRHARIGIHSSGDANTLDHLAVHTAYNVAVTTTGADSTVSHSDLRATNYGVTSNGPRTTIAHNTIPQGNPWGVRLNGGADDSTVVHNDLCGSPGLVLWSGTIGVTAHHNTGTVVDNGSGNKVFKNDGCP